MTNAFEVDPDYWGKPQTHLDLRIADLAGRQHGVASRAQLRGLGLTAKNIDYRRAIGRLHPLHRGVYAVGHRVLSREGRWMAAVLAGGRHAVLSHRSAAALHGIRSSNRPRIEITVPVSRRHPRGIELHFAPLPADEITVLDLIPVTTVPRTLLDLAAVLPRREVERALNEAEALRLTDQLSLDDLISRYPHRRGVAVAKAAVADLRRGSSVTKRELEERFFRFLDRCRFPRPIVNGSFQIGRHLMQADCAWPEEKVMVELDSHAFHMTPRAFERDRVRDRAIALSEWRVIRVTWRQLHDEPDELAADLRELLGV